MLRKIFTFIIISASFGAVVYGQQTPDAKKSVEKILINAPFDGSFLGVQMQEISKENFTGYSLREITGVGVEKIIENSPAAQAGLMSGDVIVKFNGEDVQSIRKLSRLINEVAPDHQAKITVLRGGSEREISATIGKRSLPTFQESGTTLKDLYGLPGIPEYPQTPPGQFPTPPNNEKNLFIYRSNSRQIGIGVAPLTEQLGDYFGVLDGKGLLISNVRENSPAKKAGLRAGDIIVEADGKKVKEISDLTRILDEKKEGDVNLTVIRDRNRQTIKVTPEISKGDTMQFDNLEKLLKNNPNQMNLRMKMLPPQIAPFPQVFNSPRIL